MKPIFIISLVLNILFLGLLFIYLFTPILDYPVVQTSLPRLCEYAKENDKFENRVQQGLCAFIKNNPNFEN